MTNEEIKKAFEKEWENSQDWSGGEFGHLDELGDVDDPVAAFNPNVDGIVNWWLRLLHSEREVLREEIKGMKTLEMTGNNLDIKEFNDKGYISKVAVLALLDKK